MSDSAAPDALSERLARVDEAIAQAARECGRDAAEITRIVVTKFHPASVVSELFAQGVRDVGENRQQEMHQKVADIGPQVPGLTWHYIGQAQTKKARTIRADASVVHSVDRTKLADALDAAGDAHAPDLDVLVQINLTDDNGRGGVNPQGLEQLTEHVAQCSSLRLRGVMAVAPLDEHPASAFARLAEYSERVRRVVPEATWISAGMTADFAEAIAAGATHLRIGSAITGPRPDHG